MLEEFNAEFLAGLSNKAVVDLSLFLTPGERHIVPRGAAEAYGVVKGTVGQHRFINIQRSVDSPPFFFSCVLWGGHASVAMQCLTQCREGENPGLAHPDCPETLRQPQASDLPLSQPLGTWVRVFISRTKRLL